MPINLRYSHSVIRFRFDFRFIWGGNYNTYFSVFLLIHHRDSPVLNVFAEQSPASAAPCRFLMRTGTPAQAEAGFRHRSCLLLGKFDDLGRFRNTTIGFWEVHPVTVRLEKSRKRRCNCGWYFDFACCGRAAAYVIMCLQTGVRPHSIRLVQRDGPLTDAVRALHRNTAL